MISQAAEELLNDIHNLGMEREIEWSAIRGVMIDFTDDQLTWLRKQLELMIQLAELELKLRN
jgi:hypothetical protein